MRKTKDYIQVAAAPLSQICSRFGDDHVDILKVDIEGAEHRVLADIMRRGPRPEVLAVEFDQPMDLGTIGRTISMLQSRDYRLEKIDGFNCTFHRHAAPAVTASQE